MAKQLASSSEYRRHVVTYDKMIRVVQGEVSNTSRTLHCQAISFEGLCFAKLQLLRRVAVDYLQDLALDEIRCYETPDAEDYSGRCCGWLLARG